MRTLLLILIAAACLAPPAMAQQKDDAKCKDHPLFTRMPDSWIHHCTEKTFDFYEFRVSPKDKQRVEGRLTKLSYYPQAAAQSKPSELQILRNFENAVKKVGGKSLYAEQARETFKVVKDGKELWVEVTAEFTGKYGLTIVEKNAMEQDIVMNAEAFGNDIRSTGHVAVYGILFETGKSALKPESEQSITEIAKLLKNDPSLKVYVVGHTDNTGVLESNMKLSQDRAAAVVQSLTSVHGIAASRLKPYGAGPYCPVATNDNEDGKAKNRRVELVKQ
jgi:OmpA-OmpF porin, OOP family